MLFQFESILSAVRDSHKTQALSLDSVTFRLCSLCEPLKKQPAGWPPSQSLHCIPPCSKLPVLIPGLAAVDYWLAVPQQSPTQRGSV